MSRLPSIIPTEVIERMAIDERESRIEQTAVAVLAAMERRYGGRLPYLGETWAEDPALIDLGEQCELAWTLQLAVLDRAPTLATVTETAFNTSTASSTDGVLHIGETS